MTEIETAWLAGLFEGEGTFVSANNGKRSRGIDNGCRVALYMTDKDVVERAAKLIGVEVRTSQPKRPLTAKLVYRIQFFGNKAVAVMEAILPFMGERRSERIKYLLAKAKMRLTPSERGRRATHFGMTSRERGIRSAQAKARRRRDNGTLEMFQ
jgi:hypothetical protein